MKKIYHILLLLTLIIIGYSCKRENIDYGQEQNAGKIVEVHLKQLLHINVDNTIIVQKLSRTANENSSNYNIDNFIVKLYKDGENKSVEEWKYNKLPEIIELKEGNYYVTIESPEKKALSETPYYFGKSDAFTIKTDIVQEINVVCKMASIKVITTISENLKKFLGEDVKVELGIGENKKSFSYKEIQPVYFNEVEDSNNILNITIKGMIDEQPETITHSFPNCKKGEALKINIDIKDITGRILTENGFLHTTITKGITITRTIINADIAMTEETIPEETEVTDEGVVSTDENTPTIVGRGFDINSTQYVPAGGMKCIVDITIPKGCKNLIVTINSSSLTDDILQSVGLTSRFDLSAPGTLKVGLESIGFPTGDKVINQKTLVFDISQFTGLLGAYGPATHKFIIKVVDQENRTVTKTLTLKND